MGYEPMHVSPPSEMMQEYILVKKYDDKFEPANESMFDSSMNPHGSQVDRILEQAWQI